MNSTVELLLATYNGEKYLNEQIASLIAQDFSDFKIVVSDGGSTDGTLEILKEWALKDSRIELLPFIGRLGAKENFSRLMETADGDYFFFVDQDDVWKKNKLSLLLKEMDRLEQTEGKETPLLVHSDLEVVNEKLGRISPSFWQYIHLDAKKGRAFSRLLLQNTVTGAACLINRPLLELARPIPPEAIMHDWWLALVAIAFGSIGVIEEQTVLYRQHGKNEVGAKPYFSLRLLKFALSMLIKGPDKEKASRHFKQTEAFAARYNSLFSASQKKTLEAFFSLSGAPFWRRIPTGIKYKFYHSGLLRKIAFLAFSRQ